MNNNITFHPDKKLFFVFIIPMLSFIGILLAVSIIINTTNEEPPTTISPQPVQEPDAECTGAKNYCIYTDTNEEKEYLVYNGSYKNEYDLQFFNLNIPYRYDDSVKPYDVIDKSVTDKFIVADYAKYQDYCKKNNLKQKYTDKDKNYLIYYYNTKIIDDLSTSSDNYPYTVNADLGDLTIKDQKVTFYIWDIIETYHGIITQIDTSKSTIKTVAYSVIVPTDEKVVNYEIKPLMYRTDFNEMLNRNPMKGYVFTYDDNIKLAKQTYINSKNTELNDIINKSIHALSYQRTVEITNPFYLEDEDRDITETTAFDFIHSVQKEQFRNQKTNYTAFTPKLTVYYNRLNQGSEEITEISHHAVIDRSEIFKQFLNKINIDDIIKEDDYQISIEKTNEQLIIKAKLIKKDEYSPELYTIEYYINYENSLITKIINTHNEESTTYSFNYTQKGITMPDGIYKKTTQPVYLKPIIYLYPTKPTDVTVTLGHPELISTSYPKYNNGWTVRAEPSGKLTDKKTGRELYSLYWEGKNSDAEVKKDGFIVKGQDTAKFLEQKLAQLGLSQREAEEFIIYWLPKMEKNNYNYIRFQTAKQINDYMPLNISPKPDTVIRVFMAFKPLERKINVTEQKLPTVERKGFTVVEWGGAEL